MAIAANEFGSAIGTIAVGDIVEEVLGVNRPVTAFHSLGGPVTVRPRRTPQARLHRCERIPPHSGGGDRKNACQTAYRT